MHTILFSLIFLINIIISQDSIGGMPFTKQNEIKLNNNLVSMPILDIEKLLLEDENRPPATPFRYGYKFNVKLIGASRKVINKAEEREEEFPTS